MNQKVLVTAVILTLWSPLALAQEQNRIHDEEMAISFALPDGWTSTKKDDAYILSSPGFNGFVLLKTILLHSINEVSGAMNDGIEVQDGSKLEPIEDLKLLGQQGVAGIFRGEIDDVEMTGYLIALMETTKQKTVLCISVSPTEKFNQSNLDYVKIMIRSVIFD